MPAVFTFSRNDNEILEELLRVFNSGRGTAREQWSMQAEMLVEPVGWDALWKLSKEFCKKFEVRFPCVAYITVTSVDFESLSANIDVLSVQHEAIRLPEVVHDVPLVELWPTEKQRELCINAAVTAEFIDLLRFYYTSIWMPWDDQDNKVLMPTTIEERMRLWSDLHKGAIPASVAHSITLLRNSAIDAHEKLRELESGLCDGELLVEDDSLLPPNYIWSCASLNARLDALMSQWTLYENARLREHQLAHCRAERDAARRTRNVAAIWEGGPIFQFEEISQWLRSRVSAEQTLSVTRSAEDALALRPEELLVCGKHCLLPEVTLAHVHIATFNGATLTAPEMRSCLLQLGAECRVRDATLHCAKVNTVILARGNARITNCVLMDDSTTCQSDFAQGIVAMAGASLLIEDCTFDNFYTGIVVHKGAQVELRNCVLKRCGVGIQMYSGCHVTLSGTTIVECSEQSIRCEADHPGVRGKEGVIEGLTIQPMCNIGSGDLQKDILVVEQDVGVM